MSTHLEPSHSSQATQPSLEAHAAGGTRRAVSDAQIAAIPGWLTRVDIELFRFFLGEQTRTGPPGDLAELGVYLGASAVLLGAYLRPGETFTVVDLFGTAGADADNDAEVRRCYGGLTQAAFEKNYRAVHGDLPVVIRGYSTEIRERAAHGRHRFVHVDASHEFSHVVEDMATARALLAPDGIVVIDDFRAVQFPGVAAAVWPELAEGLVPLALSDEKLYATWGDPAAWHEPVRAWARSGPFRSQVHRIAEHDVVRVWDTGSRLRAWVPPVLAPFAVRVRGLLQR